jgi:hypothetical protein
MLLALLLCLPQVHGAPEANPSPAPAESTDAPSDELKYALERLKLPGVKINPEERCVDVASTVCLREGLLELIACTKDTKEHEAIVVVEAKPSHIHTALLLLGARPGNPAMRRAIDEEGTRFVDLPPRGAPVDVFLVITDPGGKERERPISDFIAPSEQFSEPGGGGEGAADKFPTHTFLFAGSFLHGQGEGPRTYLCDQSGNVISISTFGDELLCLAGVHGHDNGMLNWQVDGEKLPEVGAKVTLRLRPQAEVRADPKSGAGDSEK